MTFNLEVEANTQVGNGLAVGPFGDTATQGGATAQVVVEVDTVGRFGEVVCVSNVDFHVGGCAHVEAACQNPMVACGAVVGIGQGHVSNAERTTSGQGQLGVGRAVGVLCAQGEGPAVPGVGDVACDAVVGVGSRHVNAQVARGPHDFDAVGAG